MGRTPHTSQRRGIPTGYAAPLACVLASGVRGGTLGVGALTAVTTTTATATATVARTALATFAVLATLGTVVVRSRVVAGVIGRLGGRGLGTDRKSVV